MQATLTDAVRPDRPMERLRDPLPPRPRAVLRARRRAGAVSVVAAARAGRTDHQIALDFVEAMRGAPASADESALLLRACDACADDPDADVLVSAAHG